MTLYVILFTVQVSFGKAVEVVGLLALANGPATEDIHFTLNVKYNGIWSAAINGITDTEGAKDRFIESTPANSSGPDRHALRRLRI